MSGEARDGEKRVRRRGDRGPIELNTRKCVNVNIWFGRSVALCEHSPHYGARLPRQRFITSASVPSSPSVALSSSPPSLSTLRHPTPVANPSFDISSTCCTYSLPLQCMILPPPRGDPSPLLHQSSSTLRRPERPRQKARCAPSLAAILAGSVARLVVTCLGTPVIYVLTLVASPPSRNATNGQMERAVARRVSVSASNALALARSAPIGSRYVCTWLHIVRSLGISPPCFPPFFIGKQ